MGESTINLRIDFQATGETEPLKAAQIATLIEHFLAVQMDLAEVRATVQSAFLSYTEAYQARRAQVEQSVKDALS